MCGKQEYESPLCMQDSAPSSPAPRLTLRTSATPVACPIYLPAGKQVSQFDALSKSLDSHELSALITHALKKSRVGVKEKKKKHKKKKKKKKHKRDSHDDDQDYASGDNGQGERKHGDQSAEYREDSGDSYDAVDGRVPAATSPVGWVEEEEFDEARADAATTGGGYDYYDGGGDIAEPAEGEPEQLYGCDYNCGFQGSFDVVAAHEEQCPLAPGHNNNNNNNNSAPSPEHLSLIHI